MSMKFVDRECELGWWDNKILDSSGALTKDGGRLFMGIN